MRRRGALGEAPFPCGPSGRGAAGREAASAGDGRTLCTLLESWAARGDRPAIIAFRDGGSESWSYGGIAAAARSLALGLLARGLARLEPVILCARNSPEWAIAYFGILEAGALPVPVSDSAPARELAHVRGACGARRIVTSLRRAPDFRALAGDLELILLDGEGAESWRTLLGAAARPVPAPGPEDPASLLWTSGTTGVPKGVPLTHRNFIANLDGLMAERIADPDDRILLPLPLHHAYAFTVGLLLAFAAGAVIVLPSGVTGPEITEAARKAGATAVIGVPRLYAALLEAVSARVRARGAAAALLFESLLALSIAARRWLGLRLGRLLFRRVHAAIGPRLRRLACGGARLDPGLGWRLEGLGYEVLTGYGLTETGPILTMSRRGAARIGAEGRAAPGVELRIAEEPGQPFGEVLAKGPNVFAGYWRDEAATREAFTADGWFKTGDLGFLDADGYLHIVGRKTEMIVLPGGENVFPEEVEAVYAESPAIREIAVLADAGRLVALVVPDEAFMRTRGTARIGALLREELDAAGARLAPYQRITGFAVTREALPRTHLGKIKRHPLPALYAAARIPAPPAAEAPLSEADRALLADPLAAAIRDWLVRRYPGRPVMLDSVPQLDLGIDSLEWVTLTLELQERFGVGLTAAAIARVVTVRDLIAEAVAAKAAAAGPPRPAATGPEDTVWMRPQGPWLRLFAFLVHRLSRVLSRAAFRLRAEGVGNLPAQGPLLLAPNHASYLDPFLVAAALPLERIRRTQWAGWTGRLFTNAFTRFFSRVARVIPVDTERAPAEGLAYGLAVLRRGETLVWFPEGRRTATGEIGPFLRGVGYLLAKTGAAAVPVRIIGSFEALPRGRWLPRPARVTVIFGRPQTPAALEAAGEGPDQFARIADGLRKAVQALAPAETADKWRETQ